MSPQDVWLRVIVGVAGIEKTLDYQLRAVVPINPTTLPPVHDLQAVERMFAALKLT